MTAFPRIAARPAPMVVFALLAACAAPLPVPEVGPDELIELHTKRPTSEAPNTCWDHEATPAVIETVTEHVMVQPPQVQSDGTVTSPGAYRTETRQVIVRERQDLWFRTPCTEEMTPEMLSALQRALAARGLYGGAVTGEMDRGTQRAVRRYQQPLGLDSSVLSLAAARKLGLSVVERPVDPTAE